MDTVHENYFGKVYEYPDGKYDIIACNRPVFRPASPKMDAKASIFGDVAVPAEPDPPQAGKEKAPPKASNIARAQSRARASVRRLALANQFTWFVTLTVDPQKIDSYDAEAVTRRLNQWLTNKVRRNGLAYILVPERHQSGRIHYHGFFNDALEVVDSGTISMPGEKRPRRPKSKAQWAEMLAAGGHVVYNLPAWTYGFTTAIALYGEYSAAVGYVTKYIGKESEKIAGRWFYSGGELQKPVEKFVDICYADLLEMQTEEFLAQYGQGWVKGTPGGLFAGINGLGG